MTGFGPLRAELRQLRRRTAFRIAAAPPLAQQLAGVLAELEKPPAAAPLDEKLLADAATGLWRAQRRLARGDGARDRQTGRYLLTCREALTGAGLMIQEHEGDRYHPGRSLEVLAFEEAPGVDAGIVVETVRPTVYLHDRRIQMGQVIVAGPSAGASASFANGSE